MATERPCVYTVLFGGYEDLLEQPMAAESTVDFICFTDDPALESDTWEIRVVSPVIPTDSTRSARYPKLCPHDFLADHDLSLYIDNSVLLTSPPEEIIDTLLPSDALLAAVEHSFRDTVREEFEAVTEAGYEAAWVCDEQLSHYRQSDPDVLHMKPLFSGVLVRRHMHPVVVSAMDTWWTNVLRFSRRDQLSFQVALRASDLTPATMALDLQDNGLWEWPASTGRVRSRGGALPVPPDVEALERALADRDLQIEHLRSQADDLEHRNALLDERIQALHASTSWKLTAGVRWFGRWVEKVRSNGG